MNRRCSWKLTAILGGTMLVVAWAAVGAQSPSPDPQSTPKVTAEQQKELDQLKQLEQRLQTDRDAVHAAITQYGWDSDQTDAAQDQLFRDRAEYRKLRRSLRTAGVAVPPPGSMGRRAFRSGPGRENWGGPWYGRRGAGWGHRGRCRCCGW
jgi:uncharacterized protein YlxW (UPF0749 family)